VEEPEAAEGKDQDRRKGTCGQTKGKPKTRQGDENLEDAARSATREIRGQ